MQTVKGAQRQVVVVQTNNSRYFEEAFFVVRREARRTRVAANDMLLEANRILRENAAGGEHDARRRLPRAVWFLFGVLLGAAAGLLLLFLRTAS